MKRKSTILRILLTIIVFLSVVRLCTAQNNELRDPNAPANTIKIPGRDVYVNGMDEPSRMPWRTAKIACECKGKGWRLPTIGELETIYQYKGLFGDFSQTYYWSMDQDVFSGKYYNMKFSNGKIADEEKGEYNKVRCVWVPQKSN